jgi:putative membrane protein
MKRMGLLSIAFVAMLAVACGGDGRRDTDAGDTPATVGTAGEKGPEDIDRGSTTFIKDRLEGGMAEVKLGELASQKAQNAQVKAFAQMMVKDHTKAGEELKQIAAQHKIQAPTAMEDDHRDLMERLSKLQGAEFDRQYIQAMVDSHEDTVDALEPRVDAADRGLTADKKDGPVRPEKADNPIEQAANQWAAKTLPTVRQHLERAKQINDNLGRRTTTNDQ